MTKLSLYKALDEKYPRELSCPWDNDGLMIAGNLAENAEKILIALDATENVLDYAVKNGFDTIVTHHPILFRGLKSVTALTVGGRKTIDCIKNGITVISLHTRLDAADGGVNDTLASALGFETVGKFGDEESPTLGRIVSCQPSVSAHELAVLVKEKLGCESVRLNGNKDARIEKIALCGGDGKDLTKYAAAEGCHAFITGDSGYNMALDAAEDGMVTIEAGHYHTEFVVCRTLADVISKLCDAEIEVYADCGYTVI